VRDENPNFLMIMKFSSFELGGSQHFSGLMTWFVENSYRFFGHHRPVTWRSHIEQAALAGLDRIKIKMDRVVKTFSAGTIVYRLIGVT
jgi:hypothetical protein